MKIIPLNKAEMVKVNMDGAHKAWKQMPLSQQDGVPVYSYRVFTVEPGGYTPYHQHPYEHMNYIIEGDGALVNEAGEMQELKTGDFAMVDPDEKHQYRKLTADKPLKMILSKAVPGKASSVSK